MDTEKLGDYTEPPRPEHMTFESQTLYHMLTYTICLLAGTSSDDTINGVLRNVIHAIAGRYIFNVEDMFIRILSDSTQIPHCLKVFAPWIQRIIDHNMCTDYLAKESHKSFIPPVRDTVQVLQDLSLGKSLADSPQPSIQMFDGPKIPQREKIFKSLPPTHMEVSMRTQQLLLQHITEDQRKKEHLAKEPNSLHNRTRLLPLIVDENKKCLWKLLQKFLSEKKLSRKDLK